MQLDQMKARVSTSPVPSGAQRTRAGMRGAMRIGSRYTASPRARNPSKADPARQEEVGAAQVDASSLVDTQTLPASVPEPRNSALAEEDAWLNDSMPPLSALQRPQSESQPSQPQTQQETHINNRQSLHPSQPEPEAYIRTGHRLWPVVLHLSTRIWEELTRVQGRVPGQKRGLIDFVRRRSLALLRNESALAGHMRNLEEMEQVLHSVVDEVLGYGPLEGLLRDESVSEIMVVGPRLTFVERDGKILEVRYHFEDERHMMRIVENILRKAGRHVETNRLTMDARLPDGTLLNVVMPPPAIKGPTITIRKPSHIQHGLTGLVRLGAMSQEMADFLATCVRARLNILICGERRSGRTTLLNALATCISADERIVTIEDMAELRLSQKHVVALEAYLIEDEHGREAAMRNLVTNAQRMQPGRMIVGECRGDETVALLQAMHAGYDGSLATVYAKQAQDCLNRLEMMWLVGEPQLPLSVIRKQIARCLNLIIHVGFASNGSRKVLEIVAVHGDDVDGVKQQSIYHYADAGVDEKTGKSRGRFEPQGIHPACFTIAASAR
ncbi:MAG TPA: ATPase, T2SS/T4P/T4SS family [Ktedonobacteraceae bacterium]|nr:ATPase, T2SS/T4P/T4SS family [Ktedonobacteraceae bacterium]